MDKGAQTDGLIHLAFWMLALSFVSLFFDYYTLWDMSTDEVWQQRNVDAPGIALAIEALIYPLTAMFITIPSAALIWKQSKYRVRRLETT